MFSMNSIRFHVGRMHLQAERVGTKGATVFEINLHHVVRDLPFTICLFVVYHVLWRNTWKDVDWLKMGDINVGSECVRIRICGGGQPVWNFFNSLQPFTICLFVVYHVLWRNTWKDVDWLKMGDINVGSECVRIRICGGGQPVWNFFN